MFRFGNLLQNNIIKVSVLVIVNRRLCIVGEKFVILVYLWQDEQ